MADSKCSPLGGGPDRDPKVTPNIGDVLRKGTSTRRVASTNLRWVTFLVNGRRTGCSLAAWRTWAKSAEVVERAKPLA